jgi:hypothetical protein
MGKKREKNQEEKAAGGKWASLQGNHNARTSEHGSKVVRLKAADVDLLFDVFASEGNINPTAHDFANAIHYALVQVYRRKVENDQAIIV